MTNGHLVNHDVDQPSVQRLSSFYDERLIPAEKKPFLIDLKRCSGPLLAVDGKRYILDVASQIASKGLGFNAGAMFGAAQFVEAWTGNTSSQPVIQVREAIAELFNHRLCWPDLHLHLCNSGAEANETALGICFHSRKHEAARKVIAFEGSFHGRMMVSLASTWNKQKREPFAWNGFETSFAPYPVLPADDVTEHVVFPGWRDFWRNASQPDYDLAELNALDEIPENDQFLKQEIKSLDAVRQFLETGEHYAILIEPMQCEGGDRYSSSRFHNGLLQLAKAFDIPLVYDEIQTGFGLGGDFFWHQKFELQNEAGLREYPDHVVLAKKAQVGAVLSHNQCPFVEQYSAASLIRGFIHASMIDQFEDEIGRIENRSRKELGRLIEKHQPHISRPRSCGLSFAFDFADPATLKKFVSNRFQHGLLYYPAGQHAARFRFNLAFRGHMLDIAWQQIESALDATLDEVASTDPKTVEPVSVPLADVDSYFDYHSRLISAKLMSLRGFPPLSGGAKSFIEDALKRFDIPAEVVFLTEVNWQSYRQQVWDLQGEIYEPLRQTEIEKFDQLIEADHSLSIALVKNGKIIAMAFAAPPINFPKERGVPEDPYFENDKTIYMLDLTVIPEFRGRLGRVMKQALCLAAQSKGLEAVQGRNRDRLARGMWAINLSLGSFFTRRLKDDYQDENEHRDCLMYRCELHWQDEAICLSNGVQQPLGARDLTEEFCESRLPLVPNKLTLSNFVTHDYLKQLQRVFKLLPENLRHGYTASGMSECVDKLVKTIYLKRNPRKMLVTIGESFFGHGSFLSRAISGVEGALFESERINVDEKLQSTLSERLSSDDVLAVFVEPFSSSSGVRIDETTLGRISQVCKENHVPLVTNDTSGMFHRYSEATFLPSGIEGFEPDAGMLFLGGQMAICYMTDQYFDETPLRFISTWDGDAFSMAQFDLALNVADKMNWRELKSEFHNALVEVLESSGVTEIEIEGGVGWFRGTVDANLDKMFRKLDNGRFLVCPGFRAMKNFLDWRKEQTT